MIQKHRGYSSFFYLFGIFVLSALARFLFLDQIPNGFFSDEASTGYDAYSILITGRDQYGTFLPLFARSFGDYNESLYRFFTVAAIHFWGLNEFAVRLPAALIGSLTIPALYLLAKEIFQDKRVALLAALLLSISPWHIQFSRVAFRSILFPFFFIWGLFFFLKGVKNPKYLLLSLPLFSLTLYTYASARVFVPLFLLFLVLLYRHELWNAKNYTVISFAFFLIVLSALMPFWISPQGMARANALFIQDLPRVLQNYATYYSPKFLFLTGDPRLRHSPLNIGQLYHFELVTVPAGLLVLAKIRKRRDWVILIWLFLYPLPATLTGHEQSLRAIIGTPLFPLISALGMVKLLDVLNAKKRSLLVGLTAAIVICNLILYVKFFFVDYPQYGARAWQYGMREAITDSASKSFENVYISDQFALPHIFVLFYTEYPPSEYHRAPLQSISQSNHFYTDFSIGKYHIKSMIDLDKLDYQNTLLITLPDEAQTIIANTVCEEAKIITSPDGREVIKLLECAETPDLLPQ